MSDDPRVDELRQQLRSLGYLDAGVDRFVLAPAIRRRRPAAFAWVASLRSGLIAGALVGPAAAVGLSTRLPALITGVQDAIVAAVYMALLFGAAITLLTFIAAVAASAVTRSSGSTVWGRAVSTSAGVLVAVACLMYLTLLWGRASAGFAWEAPIWTAFALVIAVGISLLVGHVATLTVRAVSVARTTTNARQARVPAVSWPITVAAALTAAAGAAAVLLATSEKPHADRPSPLTVRSTATRVTVLAIDGFDAQFYGPLRPDSADVNPALFFDAALDSARVEVSPVDSRDPARLWTTIATGRSANAHGVQGLETRRIAGLRGRLTSSPTMRLLGGATDLLRLTRPSVASNFERRVKTFWEIAAQAGLRTGVVHWWATWPADPAAGTVLSDRAMLRLERGGPLDAEIAPPETYERLKTRWPHIRAQARSRATNHFSESDPKHGPALSDATKALLIRSGELDSTIVYLADALDEDFDLLVIYLPGLDIAQQTLFGDSAPAPSQVDERVDALRRYYRYLDVLLATAVATAHQPGRSLFVITQPGRLHQGRGMLALLPSRSATSDEGASVLDIAPTILHTLGVPVARELEGRVIRSLFAPEFWASNPVRFVDSYGLRGPASAPRAGTPLDDEMIERLRSLGYLR